MGVADIIKALFASCSYLEILAKFQTILGHCNDDAHGTGISCLLCFGRCMPLLGVNFVHTAVGGNAYYTCGVGITIIHVGVGFALPLYV